MLGWTREQEEAIGGRNSNLLVTAAAGSGKTAVLVERIIQMIVKDGIDIDRLLIVTFTNAAAAEMRARISSALLAGMESAGRDEEHLRKQLNLLTRSSISTLHSFCTDIIRKHFHLLKIDPHFRIGDAAETELIKTELLEELFESEYEKGCELFLGLVEMYGSNIYDTPLQQLVLRIYDFIQSQPRPLQWIKDKTGEFGLDLESLGKSSWTGMLREEIRIELQAAGNMFEQARRLCEQAGGPLEYRPALLDDLRITGQLQQVLNQGLSSFYSMLNEVKHSRLARIPKNAAVDEALQLEVKSLRDDGKKIIAGLREMTDRSLEDHCRDLHQLLPFMDYLGDMVASFSQSYQEKKTEKGMLDFNDLEHMALQILANAEIAEEYRRQYVYILVDEYQDSNLVQDSIINLIKRENNLFMVGDVKQSIYRFRLADPTLFMEKQSAYGQAAGGPNRRIDLNTNFRSRPEIIAAVNFLFRHLMTREFGEINYGEDACLYPGLDVSGWPDAAGRLTAHEGDERPLLSPRPEFYIIENHILPGVKGEPSEYQDRDQQREEDEEAGSDENEDDEMLTDMEAEARLLAGIIKQLTGARHYDRSLQAYRRLEYRDMVILLRSTRNAAGIFLERLLGEGIPSYADVNNGYFETLEIEIFINLLKIIDNKRQDVALLSVMRSPLGGFSLEELIKIRLGRTAVSEGRVPPFFEALSHYVQEYQDELSYKLSVFLDKLKQWKADAGYMQMDEFIWKLLMETGFYYYVGAMPGGGQRQANLRILGDRARQFQNTSIKGLFNFIKFIDRIRSGSGDMGSARIMGENENVVRIMSIHKSKGLEFPVVIIAGMGKRFNRADTSAPILLHRSLGLGPRFVDPVLRTRRDTLPGMVIRNRIRLENLAEEMRILYVACTRPQDKLIMVGTVHKLENCLKKWSKEPNPRNLSRGQNYLDWVVPVLMRHRDGSLLRQLAGQSGSLKEIIRDESSWKIQVINEFREMPGFTENLGRDEFKRRLEEGGRGAESKDMDMVRINLDWQYPFRDTIRIPSKLSVSDIKRLPAGKPDSKTGYFSNDLEIPLRKRNQPVRSGISAAQKGTLLHFVMQHLDLAMVGCREDIEKQLRQMIDRELLKEEEAAVIELDAIHDFFASRLGRRVLEADKVFREVPFNLLIPAREIFAEVEGEEQLLVQGVIDLYFQEGEELVLLDYKSDWILPGNEEEIVNRYRLQVQWYKKALERIQGRKVKESYLYLFDINREIRIS